MRTVERSIWQEWLAIGAGGVAVLGVLLVAVGLGLAAIQSVAGIVIDRWSFPPATVTQVVGENTAVLPIDLTIALIGGVVLVIGLVLSLIAWLLRRGDRSMQLPIHS